MSALPAVLLPSLIADSILLRKGLISNVINYIIADIYFYSRIKNYKPASITRRLILFYFI